MPAPRLPAPSVKRGNVLRTVQAVWRRGRKEDKRVGKDERVCGVEGGGGGGGGKRVSERDIGAEKVK